jgi:hypothetical protein
MVRDSYIEFLNTCYCKLSTIWLSYTTFTWSAAPDERRQRALPVAAKSDDQSTNYDVAMTTLGAPEKTEPTLDTSALVGVSTHSTIEATDPFGAPEATGKRKRGKEHRKGPVAKKRLAAKKGAAVKKGAVSKGKKKRCDMSGEEESGPESDMEDSEDASSSESSSSDSEAEDSADEPLIQALGARHSARKTTMDPKRPDREDFPINPVVIGTLDQVSRSSEHPATQPSAPLVPRQPSPSLMSEPLVPPALIPTEPSPSLVSQPLITPALVPSEPSPSLASQPLVPPASVPPALVPSEPSPSLASQPLVPPASQPIVTRTPTLSLPDPKWPDWFMRSYELLSARNLGPTFTKAIKQYVALESCSSFDIGGPHAGFKKTSRPSQVDWWVGRGRSKAPLIKDIASFGSSWWKWWKALQPSWRNAAGVDGRLDSSHRTGLAGDEGWSAMDKHGQNAFLTMLATLIWWNSGLLDKGEEGINDPGWTAAVEDVEWAISQVLGWR